MKKLLVLFLSLFFIPVFAVLGGADCPTIVQQAITTTNNQCSATGRNQACYGYITLQAQPQPGIPQFNFAQPGDKVSVDAIQSLRLSPMQVDKGIWGIALMRLQASLPSTASQNITVLTFGDVQMDNAVVPPTRLDVVTTANANMRLFPNETAAVMGSLPADQALVARERLPDNSWLRVQLPDSDQMGWVSAALLQPQGDLSSLNIAQTSQPAYRPMQSFYFQSNSSQPGCSQMPTSGLMIQTPEGSGEVRLWINEVRIDFGSTVLFEAQAGGTMSVTTVEGHARIEAMGITQMALAGSRVQVPLSTDLKPAAPPLPPETYDAAPLQNLPLALLERPITIHPALTQAELIQEQQVVAIEEPAAAPSSAPATSPGSSPETTCSGANCNGQGSGTVVVSNSGNSGGGAACTGSNCGGQGTSTAASGPISTTVDAVENTLCALNLPILRRLLCGS